MSGGVEERPAEATRVVALLDALRAAELAGADAVGGWLEHCRDPALRGGLRVVRTRDLAHAALAAERCTSLGAAPGNLPSERLASLAAMLAAPGPSDRAKLTILLARLPPDGGDPLGALVVEAGDDVETRALLDAMADDDRASLAWLRAAGASAGSTARPAHRPLPPAPRQAALRRLDALRAAEAASADVFAAWAAASTRPALRGGLRVIAAREASHAALLESRLRELGGEALAAVPAAAQADAIAAYGGAESADDAKLERLLGRYPDAQSAAEPASALAVAMGEDAESREMLRLVAAAERATIAWLRSRRASVSGRPTGPVLVAVGDARGHDPRGTDRHARD